MTREEQLKDIIAKASKPEVKAMAEAELQKLGLMETNLHERLLHSKKQ